MYIYTSWATTSLIQHLKGRGFFLICHVVSACFRNKLGFLLYSACRATCAHAVLWSWWDLIHPACLFLHYFSICILDVLFSSCIWLAACPTVSACLLDLSLLEFSYTIYTIVMIAIDLLRYSRATPNLISGVCKYICTCESLFDIFSGFYWHGFAQCMYEPPCLFL